MPESWERHRCPSRPAPAEGARLWDRQPGPPTVLRLCNRSVALGGDMECHMQREEVSLVSKTLGPALATWPAAAAITLFSCRTSVGKMKASAVSRGKGVGSIIFIADSEKRRSRLWTAKRVSLRPSLREAPPRPALLAPGLHFPEGPAASRGRSVRSLAHTERGLAFQEEGRA